MACPGATEERSARGLPLISGDSVRHNLADHSCGNGDKEKIAGVIAHPVISMWGSTQFMGTIIPHDAIRPSELLG